MFPPLSSARRVIALGLTLLVTVVLAVWPRIAGAQATASETLAIAGTADGGIESGGAGVGESVRALNAAKAALAASPPDRDGARRAFEQATTAGDDPGATAEAYFRLGFLEEEDGDFERALTDQRACMAKYPGSSWARSARQRIHWMTARSEGGFQPLARLQSVRRSPVLGNDPAALDALARDAEAFPPGRVRAEARMFVAEAWLTRMNRPADAIPELRRVAEDPASDSMDAALAHRRLVEAFVAVGRLDDAGSELARSPSTDPELAAQVHRLIRRRLVRRIAVVELVLFALLAAVAIGRRRLRGGVAARGKAWRVLRVAVPVMLALSVAAAAFLWLDATSAKYLEGLGL